MPIYEYVCNACGSKLEIFRHFYDSDDELTCPICEQPKTLERQFSTFSSTGAGSSCGSSSYGGWSGG